MLKLAQVPQDQLKSPSREQRYFAFLSYSHKDEAVADWLHRELERYRVPSNLSGQSAAGRLLPATLRPIFRDRQELAAADDLGFKIRDALAASQFLIVLCSPSAAQSKWTNAEVDAFKRVHPRGHVLAAIVAGEPFASESVGHEQEECFPPALRTKYERGRPTSKKAEPLAADLRESGDGKRIGLLKLIAGMLGVGLDELVQREAHRRRRRVVFLAVGFLAAMGITGALATAAIDSHMAAVHARDDAEDQRGQALEMQANEAMMGGDMRSAEKLYEQALRSTAGALRRNPNDPQRVFAHAQNVFYVGEVARQRGDRQLAEKQMIEYRRLCGRLVELQPTNLKWRAEVHYADTNLGVMLFEERHFDDAAARFQDALHEAQVLESAAPGDRARQAGVAGVMAWLADSRFRQGRFKDALSLRQKDLAILNSLSSENTVDPSFAMRVTNAQMALGSVYAATGQVNFALEHFRDGVANTDRLIPLDDAPSWYRTAVKAKLTLATFALQTGNRTEAAAQTRSACNLADKLARQTAGDPSWRSEWRDCWLMRTRLALVAGQNVPALSSAQRAVSLSKAIDSGDHVADRFALARAYRLLGDAQNQAGNRAAAHDAWSSALGSIPSTTETPPEMDEHARVLQRMGRSVEAAAIESRLKAIGYYSRD